MAKRHTLYTLVFFLTDFNSVNKFENNDIVVPLKVLEEHRHKKRQDSVGSKEKLYSYPRFSQRKGSLHKGVRMGKGKGILKVMTYDKVMNSTKGFNFRRCRSYDH